MTSTPPSACAGRRLLLALFKSLRSLFSLVFSTVSFTCKLLSS
ncbi:uncharacterized protein CTRU02_207689 [Colletotrichum truncatum]|uniref:Uncharacterized protein n=1 Tax=Colletotrichum truncatum TaxID=5467 RepID=A0ACC3Z1J3_COLTU|nr:uncharacterized protein CTRU02_15825 [Colletotrichum truncatum]XP_036580812.1 uncharacterized protein CTRU02_09205 [Colletotrichum truncatum]KAF6780615.1 hypothetical protein CTRU02_15825 [Colletotrichum truncatum]KAF6788884.1 hypothetical protein CTRU02_09205 [Colletotrichum truncatum]